MYWSGFWGFNFAFPSPWWASVWEFFDQWVCFWRISKTFRDGGFTNVRKWVDVKMRDRMALVTMRFICPLVSGTYSKVSHQVSPIAAHWQVQRLGPVLRDTETDLASRVPCRITSRLSLPSTPPDIGEEDCVCPGVFPNPGA
jgi:hypothetical protein